MNRTIPILRYLTFFVFSIGFAGMGSSLVAAEDKAGFDYSKAISEAVQSMEVANKAQADVLALEIYSQGASFLAEARLGIKEDYLPETIFENAQQAKQFFINAVQSIDSKKTIAGRILKDRKAVLLAVVRKSPALIERLKEIDEDLIDESDNFSEPLDPDDFADIQKKYFRLETKSIQYTALANAKQVIDQANEDDADDVAPKTLHTAQLDYKTAINKIDLSPRNPSIYKESVNEALNSAAFLFDVMNVIKGAEGTPEQIAIQIVKQKRALGELSSNVGKLEENLKTTKLTLQQKEGVLQQVDTVLKMKDDALKDRENALKDKENALQQTTSALQQKNSELKKKEGVLKTQQEQLARASTQVRFQKAMDEAREVIPETDALVYQQGLKLVFRLKTINFKTGRSEVPEFSKPLITKVNAIIKKLDAKKVVVQGHTDSVGTSNVNLKLSKARATSVAHYLHSHKGGYKISYAGYGESHPIASNETEQGRATNRRVDLVVSVKE